ncbi:MAG: hypothetical protein OXP08_06540, partial [bacterium]|nr:hypothetical protein [bacterium]
MADFSPITVWVRHVDRAGNVGEAVSGTVTPVSPGAVNLDPTRLVPSVTGSPDATPPVAAPDAYSVPHVPNIPQATEWAASRLLSYPETEFPASLARGSGVV